MVWRRMPDPRNHPFPDQPPGGLGESRRFLPWLPPVDVRGLVAPFRQPGHGFLRRSMIAKKSYRRLLLPENDGSKNQTGILRHQRKPVSRRAPRLERGKQRIPRKRRQESPVPEPQPGDRDEIHSQILAGSRAKSKAGKAGFIWTERGCQTMAPPPVSRSNIAGSLPGRRIIRGPQPCDRTCNGRHAACPRHTAGNHTPKPCIFPTP